MGTKGGYGKPAMGTDDDPRCPMHPQDVRMRLRTLHSDHLAPGQVLGEYACPECGAERRLPIATAEGRARPDAAR